MNIGKYKFTSYWSMGLDFVDTTSKENGRVYYYNAKDGVGYAMSMPLPSRDYRPFKAI